MTEDSSQPGLHRALERALRTSDQSCTAYSVLRDRCRSKAMILDLAILMLSAWLTAMVFVQPKIAVSLSPPCVSHEIWLGLLSIGAFALSLIQLQVNWKSRAESYHQAATALSSFVKDVRPVVSSLDLASAKSALARHQTICDGLEPIPEVEFLKLKRVHKLKVELSRHLDAYPGTIMWLWRLKILWRDNIASLYTARKVGSGGGDDNG